MERADHAAFEDRPETFNRVRMDRADNILALAVVNFSVRDSFSGIAVAVPIVRREQANLVGNRFAHEIEQSAT